MNSYLKWPSVRLCIYNYYFYAFFSVISHDIGTIQLFAFCKRVSNNKVSHFSRLNTKIGFRSNSDWIYNAVIKSNLIFILRYHPADFCTFGQMEIKSSQMETLYQNFRLLPLAISYSHSTPCCH